MEKVSVVIPAYNEQDAIGAVIDAIKELNGDYEIVVVDDGSTDDTADVAKKHGAVVRDRPGNVGYGKSLKEGIHLASHDTIVITDADGTYPIDRIPDLVEEYQRGFDMVVGARQGKAYAGSLLKRPARFCLRWLVEFTTGRKIPDINSGLRVFSKKTALQYESALCDTFSFTTTITLVYSLTKHTIQYLPIAYHKRVGSSKVRIFRDSLRTLQYIVECINLFNPLKLFVLLSGSSVLLGALASIVLGPAGIVAGIFSALIIFAIGLLTHASVKKQY